MKRSFLLAMGVALVIASGGCAQTPSAAPTTPPSVGSSAGPSASVPATASRTAAIYIAVLRRYLTSGESSFPGTLRHVYVWSTATPSASDPMRSLLEAPVGDEISADDRASIAAALADLPIKFVDSPAGLVESSSGCAQVPDNGILIALGPPEGAADDVTVGIGGFFACEGATWLTYAVSRDGGDWQVTGTVGGMAIA